jgi:hypothetical protein
MRAKQEYKLERNQIIYNRYMVEGCSLKEIASEFGLGITRIHTIVKNHLNSIANANQPTTEEVNNKDVNSKSCVGIDKRRPRPCKPETVDAIMRLLIEI